MDIMLMSASSSEILTLCETLFAGSPVTPAVRANDTTEIWLGRGGQYGRMPSRPFRSATIDHMMCGKAVCTPAERRVGPDLGLYSVTFNNDAELDRQTLQAYRDFRLEAETKGFRHFLEVFPPNACGDRCPPEIGPFLNDLIARSLAGVTERGRPLFLKMVYTGPEAMEEIASYDRHLIPGILGGSAGTTYDAFYQLWEAKQHGARAALYGRKINSAEDQELFVQHLRWVADGEAAPEEAVRSYHGELQARGIPPWRSLDDDLQRTQAPPPARSASRQTGTRPGTPGSSESGDTQQAEPDFSKMTQAEKVEWNLRRFDRIFG